MKTCTGCGALTELDYDDPKFKIGVLCKECREAWDRSCEPELKIIKDKPESKWLKFEHTVTRWLDFNQMLREYRNSLGLETLIDTDCQDVADRFINEQKYLGENEGIPWLNIEMENIKWNNQEIAIFHLDYDHQRRYTDFTDIFRRNETLRMLKSKKLKIGIARDSNGIILILAQRASLHNPYQIV